MLDRESYRKVFFRVLIEIVGDVLFVDVVAVPVDKVVVDDVVGQLFFQRPTELVDCFSVDAVSPLQLFRGFRNSGEILVVAFG